MAHYAYSFAINALRMGAHLGFFDDERAARQPVEVSLRLYFESAPACMNDDHASFIDYAELSGQLCAAIKQRHFRLIEFMAQELFNIARAYVDAHGEADAKLWLSLTKCKPAVPHLEQGASFVLSDLPADATMVPHA